MDLRAELHNELVPPRLIGVTDCAQLDWPHQEAAAGRAIEAGLSALMLRERTFTDEQLEPIARRLRSLTQRHGALLIVNRRLELARRIGADGVHLGKIGPTLNEARERLGSKILLGYSAHSAVEALEAFAAGAGYVTFSPIYETPGKSPAATPLGLVALAELTSSAPGPVIALGGIGPQNAAKVLAVGAHGIAMIRSLFSAEADPADATRALLRLIAEANPS